jgi:hypothetical protein
MANATTCPETILASIPWYPDGLSAEDRGAVEAHAADCRACRDELAFLRGDEEPAIELPDPERFYARVLARIASDTDERAAEWRAATARRVGQAARQASVAAGILVAVISGMLTTGAIWVVRVAPTYETASVAPVSAEGVGPSVEVVFRRDAQRGRHPRTPARRRRHRDLGTDPARRLPAAAGAGLRRERGDRPAAARRSRCRDVRGTVARLSASPRRRAPRAQEC